MKVILTGVTGVAGSAIFRHAVADTEVKKITVLSRRELPAWLDAYPNDKTDVVVMDDFLKYTPELRCKLADHDACIWALGKTSVGMSEQEYTRITYDYTMHFVEQLQEARREKNVDSPFRIVFISGEGADQTEKGVQLFARIKGRTEKALLAIPTSTGIKASIMRPGYFHPSKEHPRDRLNVRGPWARAADTVMGPLFSTIAPSMYTPIGELRTFAVETAKGRWANEDLFRNARMRELIKGMRSEQGGAD